MSNTKIQKLKIARTSTPPLRLERAEAVHVGVDVPKASSRVALFSDRRGLITTWVQPARPEVLLKRLRPMREGIAQVVSLRAGKKWGILLPGGWRSGTMPDELPPRHRAGVQWNSRRASGARTARRRPDGVPARRLSIHAGGGAGRPAGALGP